jgi:monoterpene epsilon-lactone hydrolase
MVHRGGAQSSSPPAPPAAILSAMSERTGEVLAFRQAPDGVEIRHLRAFVAVAEDLNFSRAAARLYLSQPALSRQIRALERLLGCELLRRTTHRVELTIAGSALLDRARRLLGDLDEAIAATQSVGGELANRMATLWAPVIEVSGADRDIQDMRTAYETFLAESAVPDTVTVRAVNAGGVPSLALDPAGEQDTAVLYLHGGGYTVGSAYGYRPLVGALVAAAGVGALVPDYRLAPEHPFPAALEDALSAYRWLAEQRGSVVLAGDSVGGGLVLSLLLALRAQDLPLPAGAVLLCPAVDLSGEYIRASGTQHDPEHIAALRRSAEAYLGGHPVDDPVLSPLLAELTGLPPLLVQAATGDIVLDESRALVERATADGVDAQLELYPAETHVFHVFWSFLPEAADALGQAGGFIRERLAGAQVRRGA